MTTIKSILEELGKNYDAPYHLCKDNTKAPAEQFPEAREQLVNEALQQIEQLISHEIIDRRPHNAKVLSDHWEDVEFV